MTNQSFKLQRDLFKQRMIHLPPLNSNNDLLSEEAVELAKKIKIVIDESGASYSDINQAVIMVDNSFYNKALTIKTEQPNDKSTDSEVIY